MGITKQQKVKEKGSKGKEGPSPTFLSNKASTFVDPALTSLPASVAQSGHSVISRHTSFWRISYLSWLPLSKNVARHCILLNTDLTALALFKIVGNLQYHWVLPRPILSAVWDKSVALQLTFCDGFVAAAAVAAAAFLIQKYNKHKQLVTSFNHEILRGDSKERRAAHYPLHSSPST